MAIERNLGGRWTQGCVPSVRQGGVWREAKGLWRNEGGVWRPVYERFESTIVSADNGGPAGGNKRVGAWGTSPTFKGASIAVTYTLSSTTTTLHLTGEWPESFITQMVIQDEFGDLAVRWRKDATWSFSGSSTTWRWAGGGLPSVGAAGYFWLKG